MTIHTEINDARVVKIMPVVSKKENECTPRARPSAAPKPPAFAGFEHINRYWDAAKGCYVARILPGEYYVTNQKEVISTVLGSCIAVCLRDPGTGVGGMNHFLLPAPGESADLNSEAHYGLNAMELLINAIMKNGGQRQNFEAKVFGGGEVIDAVTTNIGKRNIDFVMNFLELEGINLAAKDVGRKSARSVFYAPYSGQAYVKRTLPSQVREINDSERRYMKNLKKQDEQTTMKFFD